MPRDRGIITFSYLRWNLIYQRPQHLLSCLAAWPRVLFIEEPLYERMDSALLDTIARAHPKWQLVTVRPIVKVDEAVLSRYPNTHYLGRRSHEQLPAYLAGRDVCLLPFARDEATRFISPIKTPGHTDVGRAIVSPPVADAAEPCGQIIYLGDTPPAFIDACERAPAAPDEERIDQITKMGAVPAQTSWNMTAQAMTGLVTQEAGAARQTAL